MKQQSAPLPLLGLGCSPYRGGQIVDLRQPIEWAMDLGYRLLDTAEAYGTEIQIGRRINRLSRDRRGEIALISKVWQTNHAYGHVISACEDSIRRLGVEALDLYLVHSPEAWKYIGPLGDLSNADPEEIESGLVPRDGGGGVARARVSIGETWSAMEKLVERGLVRSIGVSNFDRQHLRELLRTAAVRPAVNEIASNPYRPQQDLVRFCEEKGITVMAHSPLSVQGLLADPVLRSIAERHGRSSAQVVLRWSVERGVVPIPGSTDRRHLAENLEISNFSLDPGDVEAIGGLERDADRSAVSGEA